MQLYLKPNENNHYYVYVVRDTQENIIYINFDKLINIINFRQLSHNPEFNTDNVYQLEILSNHETHVRAVNECNKLQRQLCGETTPKGNLAEFYIKSGFVKCNETGVIYRNASDACNSLGIARPRMSQHLNKRTGHKTIKGLTFSYVSIKDSKNGLI